MKELKHDLLTNKYTRVFHEDESEMEYNAPHHFKVFSTDEIAMYHPDNTDSYLPLPHILVNFQSGPIKECGVNGVNNEDLIAMVISRLEHFNQSEFRCRENSMAITKLEEALLWLRKRTIGRENRGVEGRHIK